MIISGRIDNTSVSDHMPLWKFYENNCLKVLTIDFGNKFTISISTCISSSISACCKFHTYSKYLHKYKTDDYPVSLLKRS